jgi:NAD(P)-dependent dehydrogenase (short-subunit alcohol dehydrogenase family)
MRGLRSRDDAAAVDELTGSTWSAADIGDQRGKVFVVTGANTGIGLATVQHLAKRGAYVVLACRSLGRARAAIDRVRASAPDADVSALELDLACLASVRRFAENAGERLGHIDVLINNAAVMMPPLGRTSDGFETQFGTNVLGHFALTGLLMPALEAAPGGRVVHVSSVAHWFGRIDFGNLNAERRYIPVLAYGQSKLANLMLAYEMDRRLRERRSAIQSIAAHPGGARSELDRHSRRVRLVRPLLQSVDAAALPAIRAAVDPAAQGGEFYGPSGLATMAGSPVRQHSSRRSRRRDTARTLWHRCEQLTGVTFL